MPDANCDLYHRVNHRWIGVLWTLISVISDELRRDPFPVTRKRSAHTLPRIPFPVYAGQCAVRLEPELGQVRFVVHSKFHDFSTAFLHVVHVIVAGNVFRGLPRLTLSTIGDAYVIERL